MNIKAKIIKTAKAKILVVGGFYKIISIGKNEYNRNVIKHKFKDGFKITYTIIEKGNWQLLGKLSEITEEQWKEIVEITNYGGFGRSGGEFKNYSNSNAVFNSATESGLSLLKANGVLLKNTKPDKLNNQISKLEDWKNGYKEWVAEQEKIFINPIIFIEKK